MAVELDIVRLGAQGDGIAQGAAGPVYVAGALPGERVLAEIDGARGRLTGIVQPSPDRAAPICKHFGTCGGCAAQHMAAPLYSAWKRSMLVEAFRHRGLEPTVETLVAIGPGSRRRAVLSARRTGGGIVLGYSMEGSHELVGITQCPVLVPALEAALARLGTLAELAMGEESEARLVVLACDNGIDVNVSGVKATIPPARRAALAQQAKLLGAVRLTIGGELVMLAAAPFLDLGGVRVSIPPQGFVQASSVAEAAMREITVAAVGKAKRVADLFCGAGAFTFALARKAHVTAADSDKALIGALTAAAKQATGLRPISPLVRDLMAEPLSRRELDAYDAVVLDPPRAGAKAQAEAIAKSKVPVVIAISCNPATLARDARIIVDDGYEIERLVAIDQFVFAAHVEAVAVLRKGKR